jgi:hypothetical protein
MECQTLEDPVDVIARAVHGETELARSSRTAIPIFVSKRIPASSWAVETIAKRVGVGA